MADQLLSFANLTSAINTLVKNIIWDGHLTCESRQKNVQQMECPASGFM